MARKNPYPENSWRWKAAEVLRSKDPERYAQLQVSNSLDSLVQTMARQAMTVYDQTEQAMLMNPDPKLNSVQWAHQAKVAAEEAASLELHSLDFTPEITE